MVATVSRAQPNFRRTAKVARQKHAIALTFLGTRGEIHMRSRRHLRHSALLIEYQNARIMIDCGADWLGRLDAVAPTAIVLTHAHLDHARGLAAGSPCPVYATRKTLHLLRRFPFWDRRELPAARALTIGGLTFKAYRVQHSIRAPTVGYRVSVKKKAFFYVPDVAKLPKPAAMLGGVSIYIGDGATLRHPIIRRKDGALIGHAPIATQLDWCSAAHVHRAIFTHCGSWVMRGDARILNATVRTLGREHGIDASLARDGDRLLFY